jgi:hypothetical protein
VTTQAMSASITHGLKPQQQQLATDQTNQNATQQFDTTSTRNTASLHEKLAINSRFPPPITYLYLPFQGIHSA